MAKHIPSPEECLEEVQGESIDTKAVEIQNRLAQLSPMQRRAAEILLRDPTKPFKDVCREAGYKVGENHNMSGVRQQIDGVLGPILRDRGFTEVEFYKLVMDGVRAEKHHIVKHRDQVRIITVPDYKTRLAYLQLIAKLGNMEPNRPFKGHMKHEHEFKGKFGNVQRLEDRKEIRRQVADAEYEEIQDEQIPN